MSGFDDRWRHLVAAAREDREDEARSALTGRTVLDAESAARLAACAIAGGARRRLHAMGPPEWRGLALAASLFLACMLGLGAGAEALGFGPALADAACDLARVTRHVPSTSFIPSPASVADFGAPALGELSPASAIDGLGRWLHPSRPTAETSR